MKTAILLVNLGSPNEPTRTSIAAYLKEFLSDKRVVDLPSWLWQPILRGIILRTRPQKLVAKYQAIWRDGSAPLKSITARQAQLLGDKLSQKIYWAMRYQTPSIRDVLSQIYADGYSNVLVLPLYPQFSHTTTSTVLDEVTRTINAAPYQLSFTTVTHYYEHPLYIEALKQSILKHWTQHGRPDFAAGARLLLSFHSLPIRNIERGDPYQKHCERTYELVMQSLQLTPKEVKIAYQSRFGAQKWLQPATQMILENLAYQKCPRVDVICPGFAADCLETLEEIAIELKTVYEEKGGKNYHYIACLNEDAAHVDLLVHLVSQQEKDNALNGLK